MAQTILAILFASAMAVSRYARQHGTERLCLILPALRHQERQPFPLTCLIRGSSHRGNNNRGSAIKRKMQTATERSRSGSDSISKRYGRTARHN